MLVYAPKDVSTSELKLNLLEIINLFRRLVSAAFK